ncbi:MAG: sugar nucleotide-binding protein [Ilumatobacteraceae bacterium]
MATDSWADGSSRQPNAGHRAVAPTSAQLDVRDLAALRDAVSAAAPDAIAHLAYRPPDHDVIITGTRNVAAVVAETGVRLVHLSTDVVFGGGPAPFVEDDERHPVGDYGRAKADMEDHLSATAPRSVWVRTSLLLADPDEQLAGRDLGQVELDVAGAVRDPSTFSFFIDEFRSPVRASEVAAAVLALAVDRTEVVGPLHVAGNRSMDRMELAQLVARRMGLDPSVLRAVTQAEAGVVGRRPARVVLDSSRATTLGLAPGDP